MPLVASESSGQDADFVSDTIYMQLRLPICKEIKETETRVLVEVDRLIQSKVGIGRQNPLATWAALWGLLLVYKEHMVHRKAWRHYPGNLDLIILFGLNLTS
jgi:hypothetical protein